MNKILIPAATMRKFKIKLQNFEKKAIMSEMDSMYSNKVWDLVEPPERVKSIKCKWIYKKKRGIDGKVKTFKERLVAKRFA